MDLLACGTIACAAICVPVILWRAGVDRASGQGRRIGKSGRHDADAQRVKE